MDKAGTGDDYRHLVALDIEDMGTFVVDVEDLDAVSEHVGVVPDQVNVGVQQKALQSWILPVVVEVKIQLLEEGAAEALSNCRETVMCSMKTSAEVV